jgi:hypothetical protein
MAKIVQSFAFLNQSNCLIVIFVFYFNQTRNTNLFSDQNIFFSSHYFILACESSTAQISDLAMQFHVYSYHNFAPNIEGDKKNKERVKET